MISNSKKHDAELRYFNLRQYGERSEWYATGKVFNDNKKRFKDGTVIRTSLIIKIDFDDSLIYTKKSIYKII